MVSSSRRRRDQRHRQRHRAAEAARRDGIVKAVLERLPGELHAEVHRRLPFLRRLAFASVCGTRGRMLRPEAPWLILPGAATKEIKKAAAKTTSYEDSEEEEPMPEPEEEDVAAAPVTGEEKSTALSMADGRSEASVRTSDLALLDRVIIGSSGGWLVTADERGALRMANPATGAQAALPAISTIPFLHSTGGGSWFCLDVEPFVRVRFGGPPPADDKDWGPFPPRTSTLTAAQMRQKFYRKVVLSPSPRPGSYAAMLIPDRHIGAPAFATSEDGGAWRMARSPAGVEDAIHHDGRFVSVSYAGDVEAWRRDAATGEFASEALAPRLAFDAKHLRRKYLAASPDGQLMAVLKHTKEVEQQHEHAYLRTKVTRVVFEVQVLDQAAGRWEAAADIGDAALFVGVNATVCVSAMEHRGVEAGCVYFTDDEVGDACLPRAQGITDMRSSYGLNKHDETELRATGVYSLKKGKVKEKIAELSDNRQLRWPPPAWFTPSFL